VIQINYDGQGHDQPGALPAVTKRKFRNGARHDKMKQQVGDGPDHESSLNKSSSMGMTIV
jgi:hypothetical protein